MDVKVDDHPESLLEKLESYVKAMHQICKIPVFIFVNLKQYLTEEECVALSQLISATSIGSSIADVTMIGGTAQTGRMRTNKKISGYELVLINRELQ